MKWPGRAAVTASPEKGMKVYMTNPLEVTVNPSPRKMCKSFIFPMKESKKDSGQPGSCIVDDVISTGESLNALMQLVEKAGETLWAWPPSWRRETPKTVTISSIWTPCPVCEKIIWLAPC